MGPPRLQRGLAIKNHHSSAKDVGTRPIRKLKSIKYTEKHKEELMNKLINKGKVTNRERMRKIDARNKYWWCY